ncbi:AcrB/AcrD/AcrF family protein, partial [Staphylococcus aureus]
DDSIVVVENIYRRLSDSKEELSGNNLVISATREVFKPILSSTIVTIIVFVSIPLSILIALIALKLSDVSLNILTLGALTIAIGRVIDDSIVVVENIYRRLSDSKEELSGNNLVISATR